MSLSVFIAETASHLRVTVRSAWPSGVNPSCGGDIGGAIRRLIWATAQLHNRLSAQTSLLHGTTDGLSV
ncbi:hypothetical protein GCM10022287_01260 [Gryllotalpicola koreensis]|uniref:Uncharacterized protein n=1 Tax=Gryllotalpicola koreensis TaxID=993086 RepID=A0ABP7ZPW5_9MICO